MFQRRSTSEDVLRFVGSADNSTGDDGNGTVIIACLPGQRITGLMTSSYPMGVNWLEVSHCNALQALHTHERSLSV